MKKPIAVLLLIVALILVISLVVRRPITPVVPQVVPPRAEVRPVNALPVAATPSQKAEFIADMKDFISEAKAFTRLPVARPSLGALEDQLKTVQNSFAKIPQPDGDASQVYIEASALCSAMGVYITLQHMEEETRTVERQSGKSSAVKSDAEALAQLNDDIQKIEIHLAALK
jgi:hypothetical protein